MRRRDFDDVVREALESLPPAFRERLDNVEVLVRESPTRAQVAEHGGGLYGLYEGVSLDRRSVDAPPLLPDRITIFKRSIERDHRDRESMRACIRDTVLHEVGHFLGFDEDDLERLGIG